MFFLLFRIINMELVGWGGGRENRLLHWSKVKNYTTVDNTNFLKVIRVCVWGGWGGGIIRYPTVYGFKLPRLTYLKCISFRE